MLLAGNLCQFLLEGLEVGLALVNVDLELAGLTVARLVEEAPARLGTAGEAEEEDVVVRMTVTRSYLTY